MKFSEFGLSDPVLAGVKDAGFTDCTEVQTQTLTHTLAGRDVCVQSQTGTGKTAAYLISVFELMHDNPDFQGRFTMIIAPTRELAVQIEKEAKLLGSHLGLKIASFYGGVGYVEQERVLAGGIDVAIGTPGRLLDFGEQRKLDFSRVGVVVIDEADRLFDMGFYPDLRRMLKKMPPRDQRISMLYSATLNTRARNIAWEHMHEPVEVEINPEQITVEAIDQKLIHVSKSEKFRLLLGILKAEKPENAIIFTNTKRAAEEVSERLSINGYESTFIMGDLPQRKRLRIIEDIKAGKVKLLVATDVAARGLHIDDLALVVNYDLPDDRESYVHRIGRTARAGKSGKAVSIADEQHVFNLEAIEEFLGQKIPSEQVGETMLEEDRSAGIRIHTGRHEGGRGRTGDRSGSGERRGPRGRSRGQGSSRGSSRAAGTPLRRDAAARGTGPDERVETPSHAPVRTRTPRPGGRPPREHQPARAAAQTTSGRHPGKDASEAERIAYYQEKYGEDFGGGRKRGDGRNDRPRSSARSPEKAAERTGTGRKSASRSSSAERTNAPSSVAVPEASPVQKDPTQVEPKRNVGERLAAFFRGFGRRATDAPDNGTGTAGPKSRKVRGGGDHG